MRMVYSHYSLCLEPLQKITSYARLKHFTKTMKQFSLPFSVSQINCCKSKGQDLQSSANIKAY